MKRTKSPVVAGTFYPSNSDELTAQIEEFKNNSKKLYDIETRAVIVPHAGYIYSGKLAYTGLQYLADVKNIFVIAPSHHVALEKPALLEYKYCETPIDKISINHKINEELIENFNCEYNNDAYEKEYSVEVQLPLIQTLRPKAKIIPILVSYHAAELVEKIITHYYADKDNAFVISTDLSHFCTDDQARGIDASTAQMIEQSIAKNINSQQACGSACVSALSEFSNKNNFSLVRVGMSNSAVTSGDKDRVVGYGSWMLAETTKNEFIKEHFSAQIIDWCKQSIQAGLKQENTPLEGVVPPVFYELGACFVTLDLNGKLRGCIGSILAHQSLIIDILQHASDAAFKDGRFQPLTQEEFENISISVSLLSIPIKMNFKTEDELLKQLVPNEDGLIIRDGQHQSVYLPSVWKDLPGKHNFLANLKLKAGLPANHFSETFEAFKFSAVVIK